MIWNIANVLATKLSVFLAPHLLALQAQAIILLTKSVQPLMRIAIRLMHYVMCNCQGVLIR